MNSTARAMDRSMGRSPLSWTLASLGLALCLHITRIPIWVTGMFALLCGWRALLAVRGSRLPSRVLRIAAILTIVVAVLLGYRTLNGIDAGTALLALMAALKLLETRAPRDHVVILAICYFLVLAAFLSDQSLWMLPLHAVTVWAITASLLRVTQSQETLAPAACLRLSGRMLLQSLPLMIVLFLLFPRIQGPFWALPAGERGRTGLSDEMSPGDISELSLSGEPVFRARFEGPVPPPSQRYWRGPVLHEFDGNTWRGSRNFAALGGPIEYSGQEYRYALMMEPSDRNWVFALDMAEAWQRRLFRAFDYQLLSAAPLDRPVTIQITSRTSYVAGEELSHTLRRLDTRLPEQRNPRALTLAAQMRSAVDSERRYIASVLNMFREQKFFYTLTPPKLDRNSVDDFLFNTRSGFCAHYASAFTTLMRAAGIPARVVTGYQGGEYNRVGGYWIVRQSEAHAWSEVWLEGSGWVRVDPTAMVAPERIQRGSMDLQGDDAPVADRLLREYSWLSDLRYTWDAVNTAWRERVLEFNARAQTDLLEKLGIEDGDWRALAILLGASLAILLGLLALQLARELHFRPKDPLARTYQRFCRRLERRGVARRPHEGPLDFAHRLRRLRPDLVRQTDTITRLYVELRYGQESSSRAFDEFAAQVRRFKPKRARR